MHQAPFHSRSGAHPLSQTTRPSLAGRAIGRMLDLGGIGKRLSILIYHRVLPQQDPLFPDEVDAHRFDQQLGYLKDSFNIIPLDRAVQGLRDGTLAPRSACITFDDGYADNAEVALPILQGHGVTATFFVATGFLDGGRMWNDTVIELVRRAPAVLDARGLELGIHALGSIAERRAAIGALLNALKYLPLEARQARVDALAALVGVPLPDDLMMRSEQVRQLHHAGMTIGGHTIHHPIIARMDREAAYAEIAGGKAALETMIGAPVTLFAYPNGRPGQDYQADHVTLAKRAGFEAAVCTSWGAAACGGDLFQLPRFTPWDRSQLRFTLRMAQNLCRRGEVV